MQLVHVVCRFCKSCLLVVVSVTEFGASVVGVLTDLRSSEIQKFFERGSISIDDAIELHQVLESDKFLSKLIKV